MLLVRAGEEWLSQYTPPPRLLTLLSAMVFSVMAGEELLVQYTPPPEPDWLVAELPVMVLLVIVGEQE